ncbi:MAG TPA: caspase family protein [Castellaniella sp.]|nr:caspase family protein [Castellaniella sp.]
MLTSNQHATGFRVSGVGAGRDLVLPPTSIAKVLLPRGGVTIVGSTPCFPDIVQHVQTDQGYQGSDIQFYFSNLDRRASCIDDQTPGFPRAHEMPRGTDGQRLAWVVTNSAYGPGWPTLFFVDSDRKAMAATLRRAGYQTLISSDLRLDQLKADWASFRHQVSRQAWRSVIVYFSGHGVAVGISNFFVPTNAPGAGYGPADLFAVSEVVQALAPVSASDSCVTVLVDACRAQSGKAGSALVAEPAGAVLVNHSASPGATSFDDDYGMSAWTERFVTVADTFPDAPVDQILEYANRYTSWQSEASRRVQNPVLYGRPRGQTCAFGDQAAPRRRGALPPVQVSYK